MIAGTGLLSLVGYSVGVPLVERQGPRALEAYVALYLALFLIYLVAAFVVIRRLSTDRVVFATVLGFSVLFRLAVLPSPILLSSDLYRYLWDGRVQRNGTNPYRHPPEAEELKPLRDPQVYPNINRPSQPTVYPPGAEATFALVGALAPDSILGWRLFVLACEVATGALLLGLLRRMGAPGPAILVYAWAPLTVFEGVQAGHVDFVMLPPLLLALRWRQAGRMFGAGIALGLAVLIKLYPAVLLLAWSRRGDRKLPGAFAGVVAAGYVVYATGVGFGVVGFLPRYFGSAEDFNIGLRLFLTEAIGLPVGNGAREALGRLGYRILEASGHVDPLVPIERVLSPEDERALRRHLRMPSEEIGKVLRVQLGNEVIRGFAILVLFGLLAVVLVRIAQRRREGPAGVFEAGMAFVAAYLVLVPTAMHAWYAVWIVPFLTVHRSPAWFWFTGTVPLSYLKYAWEPTGLPLWMHLIEYLPLYGLLAWEWRAGGLALAATDSRSEPDGTDRSPPVATT